MPRAPLSIELLAVAMELRRLADRLVEVASASPETSDVGPEWTDQYTSGIHRPTYLKAARSKKFPATKVGRRWIARRVDVQRWLDSIRDGAVETDTTDDDLDEVRVSVGLPPRKKAKA